MGAALEGCMLGIPSVGYSLLHHSLKADFSECLVIRISGFMVQRYAKDGCKPIRQSLIVKPLKGGPVVITGKVDTRPYEVKTFDTCSNLRPVDRILIDQAFINRRLHLPGVDTVARCCVSLGAGTAFEGWACGDGAV